MNNKIGKWTWEWAKIQDDLVPHYLESTDSTNNHAKNIAKVAGKNQLIIADYQTQGRGRGTNTWTSPQKGSALLSSWIFDLNFTPQPILTPLIGLSVFEALQEIGGFSQIALKAPNDIYMNDKKVCGILVETVSQGKQSRLIVGVGMNVFDIPKVDISSCIQNFRNGDIDDCAWNGFLIEFYKRLKTSVQESQKNSLTDEKRQKLLGALNQFSLLKEKYTEILPSGEIKTPEKTIHWMEI
jgi:biotin-[acetyl-CoA-carboxylase] ligase BirA-like protein